MKFIWGGEDWANYLERLTYDGAIGIFYKDTLGGMTAYAIAGVIALLALIGFFTVLKWLFTRKKKKNKNNP